MLRERVVTPLTVDQQDASGINEPGEMCRRVADSLGQGEVDKRALNWALVTLESVKEEKQRRHDRRPSFTPESEQAGDWLVRLDKALASMARELEDGTIQSLQETLSGVMEGRKFPKARVGYVQSVFSALGELHPKCKSPVTTSRVCLN